MPRGWRSYFGLLEEVGTQGIPELNAWGGQSGTVTESFLYFDSETMAEANEQRFLSEIGYTGTSDRSVKKHRVYGKKCEGSVTFTVYPEGGTNKDFLGLLLKHALCDYRKAPGTGPAGTYSGYGTYLHTFYGHDDWMEHLWNVGTGTGAYGLTVHVGREATNGTVNDYPYIGCRIRRITFSCAAGEELKCTVEFVGRLAQSDTTALSPAYPTMDPFLWKDATFQICTAEDGSGGTTREIDAFTITIDNALTENYVLGTNTLARTTCGAQRIVTGSFTAPFETWVRDEQQKWKDGTVSGVNIKFDTGAYVLEFRMPNIYYTGNPPSISDVGENIIELPFQATLKTTFDLKVNFVNTDTYFGILRS